MFIFSTIFSYHIAVIRLGRTTVEVPESFGFNHLFNIVKTIDLEVAILIELSASGPVQSSSQYLLDSSEPALLSGVLPTTTLRIEVGDSLAEVYVNITDDAIAEDDEAFTLTIIAHLEGLTFSQTEQATVTIKDDEGTS